MLIICDHLSTDSYRFSIYNKLIKSYDENLYFKCEYPISSKFQLQALVKKKKCEITLSFIFLIFHEYQLIGILYLILHLEYRYSTLGQKA